MDPVAVGLVAAGALVLAVLVAVGVAYSWGWSARDESADHELALVRRDLDVARDAIDVLQADASRQSFASSALVQAARAVGSARAAADPRERRRLLLSAGAAPGSPPGPAPASGGASGPDALAHGPSGGVGGLPGA